MHDTDTSTSYVPLLDDLLDSLGADGADITETSTGVEVRLRFDLNDREADE